MRTGAILGALAFQLMGGAALYLAAAAAGGLTLSMLKGGRSGERAV